MTKTKPHAAEVAECIRRIYAQRLTTTSGGNVSVRDDAGTIWVSGSGIDKATIAEQHVICVHPDGSRHPVTDNSPTQPSSELPFHRAIYAARPDIHAIIHAHPPALVAATLIHRVPDLRLIPSAYLVCGEVGWTDYCTPGTGELGASLATVFAQGHNAALMQNHGVVVAAADLTTALCRFETLEFTARSIDLASEFGDPVAATPESLAAYEQAFAQRDLGAAQLAPPSDIADNVCEIMHRGYGRHLLTSGRGSISARTSHDAFVVSPIGVDFAEASAGQLWSGDIQQPAADRYLDWHRQIYAAHPEIGSVIHSYPPFATAFAISPRPLVAATIPESYVVLREIQRISRAEATDAATVAGKLKLDSPTALLEGDGALVVGRTALGAFDRLEVLESTAETTLHASRLGAVELLGDEDISNLK